MDAKQAVQTWSKFDRAINGADSADTKALLIALKAIAEVLNRRLTAIELQLMQLVQKK